jgi:hypothetical protein
VNATVAMTRRRHIVSATKTQAPQVSAPRGSAAAYNTFISYSHAAGGQLAPALQRRLQSLGKPCDRRRALRAFCAKAGRASSEGALERRAPAPGTTSAGPTSVRSSHRRSACALTGSWGRLDSKPDWPAHPLPPVGNGTVVPGWKAGVELLFSGDDYLSSRAGLRHPSSGALARDRERRCRRLPERPGTVGIRTGLGRRGGVGERTKRLPHWTER